MSSTESRQAQPDRREIHQIEQELDAKPANELRDEIERVNELNVKADNPYRKPLLDFTGPIGDN